MIKQITRAIFYKIENDTEYYFIQQVDRTNRGYGILWEFPGGKVDPGYSVLAGLINEIKEEVGIDLNKHYKEDQLNKFFKGKFSKQLVDLETKTKIDKYHHIFAYKVPVNDEMLKILNKPHIALAEDKLSGHTKWIRYDELVSVNDKSTEKTINKFTKDDLDIIIN